MNHLDSIIMLTILIIVCLVFILIDFIIDEGDD